jgi:hypothetical protein
MFLTKIAAGAAMVGALGFSAVGLGAGIASAAPPAPVVAGILWQQDRGHGGDWGHGDGRGWGDRGGWATVETGATGQGGAVSPVRLGT